MRNDVKRCVEALRFKEDFECIECPIPAGNCEENCMLDVAADLIEALAAELEQVKQERDGLNILLGQAQSMLETRTRERDAAVEELSYSRKCSICKKTPVRGR